MAGKSHQSSKMARDIDTLFLELEANVNTGMVASMIGTL